ncbi:hypothetical protein [Gilvibacter sp.]
MSRCKNESEVYIYPILIVVVTIALYYLEGYIDNNPVGGNRSGCR